MSLLLIVSIQYKASLEREKRERENWEKERKELKEKLAKLKKELETMKQKEAMENDNKTESKNLSLSNHIIYRLLY